MRRTLLIATAVVGVILTILVVLPTFIDVNRYRGQVAATLEKMLHRNVELGEIRLGLWGGPRLRVADVAISDKAEAGDTPAVTAEGLDVRLHLLPLLSRRIAFSKLALRKPAIRLTIFEDGRTNFSDLLGPAPPGKPKAPSTPGTAPPSPRAPTPPAGLIISRLDILGGSMTIIDHHTVRASTITHNLEDVDIRLRNVSLDRPIAFDVAGTLVRKTRQPFRLKGTVGPVGTTPQLAQLPITLSVSSKGLELAPLQPYVRDLHPITFHAGSVTSDITLTRNIPDRLTTKGSIRFEAVEFTDPVTGYRPPGPLTLEVDQSVVVDLSADTIKAERLRITIGNSTVTGSGTVTKVRTAPELDLQLKSDGAALEDFVNLDPSLPDLLPTGLTIAGPVALDIVFQGSFADFAARGFVDAKRSQLAWKGLDKAAGIPGKLRFDGSYDGRRLTFRDTHLDLASLALDASGSVTDLDRPSVELTFATNTVALADWGRIVPVLKENPLHGQASISGTVAGSIQDPAKSRLAGRLVLANVGPVETMLTLAPAIKASWPRDLALAGTATAEVAFDGSPQSFAITGKADLKDGDFRYGELMKKPRGERANLTLKGQYRPGDVNIKQIALAVKDLEATGRVSVKNLEDPVIDLAFRTNQVDLARWSPAGKRLTGKVGLAIGAQGQLFKPEALAFTQAELTATGIGPLETVLEALPSVRESLPKGFSMNGQADVSVSFSGSYPNLSGRAVADLTHAGLHHPDWVVKPSGRPARLAVEGRNSGKAFTVKTFEAILGKDWIRGAANVADLDQPRGSLTVASSPMKLEQLAETLPFLKRYGLAGAVTVDINVQGDTARLKQAQAKGIVEVKDLKAQLPQLAAPLEKMTGTLELKGQEATLKRFVLAYGDSLVSLSATARGFEAPQVAFALDAPRLVLDQWKAPKKKRPLRRPSALKEPVGPPAPVRIVRVKAPVGPNGLFAWFKKVSASGSMRVRRTEYKDWLLENLQAKTSLRRGIFFLNHLTFGLHKGRYDGQAVVDLDPASAAFSFRSSLVGVDVNELLTAHAALPNTVWGRLNATLDIKGRGHSTDAFMPTLAGHGQATVTDGHINMALVRDLLNDMQGLQIVSFVPGFNLQSCTTQYTRQETTPFRSLILPVSINRGIAALAPSTLILDSPDIDVVTDPRPGIIDLPRQELDLRNLRAVFSRELTDQCVTGDAKRLLADASGRMTFPFACRGSFRGGRKPKCRPDNRFFAELATRALAGGVFGGILGRGSPPPGPQQPSPQPSEPAPQVPPAVEILREILK